MPGLFRYSKIVAECLWTQAVPDDPHSVKPPNGAPKTSYLRPPESILKFGNYGPLQPTEQLTLALNFSICHFSLGYHLSLFVEYDMIPKNSLSELDTLAKETTLTNPGT